MTTPAIDTHQLWLCLHLPQLALDVICRALPAVQADAALVVIAQQRVVMSNAQALAHGVTPGISCNAARLLLNGLQMVERNITAEQQALESLAQHCYRFTPMVVLKAPDCVLLEINGCLRLFGGVQALLAQIRDSIVALGFMPALGLGHTPLAAQLLSRTADDGLLQQPAFCAQDFLQRLYRLSLSAVFDDEKQRRALTRLGWRTLGDVLAHNTTVLGQGLGKALVQQLQKITGELPDPQLPISPRADFCAALHLPFAAASVQGLLLPMQRLLDDLQQFLLQRQLTSHGIRWQLRDTRRRDYTLPIQVARPQHRAAEFFTLTRLKLETLKLQDDIDIVTLYSERHSALAPHSNQLFRDSAVRAGGDSTLDAVLDRLRARLGDDVCMVWHSRDEILPELATQGDVTHEQASAQRINDARQQPLWLLPVPLRLQRGLYHHGALQLVSTAQRIQSYWWQQPVWRDYYRAQADDGRLYWVFRQLPGGDWFLHGVFS